MKRASQEDIDRRYLSKVRELEKEHQPFDHRVLASAMGWKSVASSWFAQERLIEKGLLKRDKRLAFDVCPVVTPAGQREIKKKAA
jgi:hypothetical protein